MRTINLFFFLLLSTISFSQRNYINSDIDDFIRTNEKYFCVSNTTVNQGMSKAEKDFYSTMRYAQVMSEVSNDGKTQIIGNVEISRVKFTKQNHLISFYLLENLKMIILKPLLPTTAKRPCVLISIGGANANLSEFPFLTTATQYLMKGYVVAYFENPNIKPKMERDYLEDLLGKETVNDAPELIFPAAVYLGTQIATAAAKYMSYHANTYNVDPNEFYGLGQSYGSFMMMHLGLANSNNYNNFNPPFTKLRGINFWVNDNMLQKTYTMKAISLWASAYPVDGPTTNNPFGELIGTDDKTRVIHFHGLLDDKVSYHSGWLLNDVNQSMYCHGVKDVIPRFKNANIDYLSFVVCGGGHAVLDTSAAKPFILGSGELSDVISEINFDNISSSYDTFKSYIDPSYYLFTQGTNIADMTARYFQDKVDLTSMPTINYITPISNTNGNFKMSDCMEQGFCIEYDANIGSLCDDNDVCTTDDTIQPNCTCAGIFQDEDGDGTCDANDICPSGPEPGSICDDNDVCTTDDRIQPNCTCAGIFQDEDGDGTCDANDICPNGPEPGSVCDDNDVCTTDDTIQPNCTCAGIFQDEDGDGTCDANDICPNGPEPGSMCIDSIVCNTDDTIQPDCTCKGIGEEEPGSVCDDGNPNTVMDMISDDCICVGISSTLEHDAGLTLSPNPFSDYIKIESLIPISKISVIYPIPLDLQMIDDKLLDMTPLQDCSSGIYILKIQFSGQRHLYRKVIKVM